MNIMFFVGHRGTGKSSYLEELKKAYAQKGREILCLDLDEEIERRTGKSPSQIFQSEGEEKFRQRETEMVGELFKHHNGSGTPVFISLGAGYRGAIPEPAHVIWLQRPTDSDGRIFFDRPRLTPDESPYQEYISLYEKRNYLYDHVCDEYLMRLEGFESFQEWDEIFFHLKEKSIGGTMTLLPRHFKRFSSWGGFIHRRLTWGIDYFELRDDLLDEKMLRLALQEIHPSKLLISFRNPQETLLHRLDLGPYLWDWPREWGRCPFGMPKIISLHRKGPSLQDQLLKWESDPKGAHLKLAVEIDSWQELEMGHLWWKEDPVNRSFLPRSSEGRWSWYRALWGRQMRLAFFREDVGSALDQPFFSEWVRLLRTWQEFAAVLGKPVRHSLTPAEQTSFFNKEGMPVVAIEVDEREDFHYVLHVLKGLGMTAAAVTAPLKERAFEVCEVKSELACELKSVNTLKYRDQQWQGHNTDEEGFRYLTQEIKDKEACVVWGGGGTRNMIRKVLPQAALYSARTGQVLNTPLSKAPEVLIWAVPRQRMSEALWPPADWKPQQVFDLNYTMDSPGREYALKVGAEYKEGTKMFRAQAEKQREFWGS